MEEMKVVCFFAPVAKLATTNSWTTWKQTADPPTTLRSGRDDKGEDGASIEGSC